MLQFMFTNPLKGEYARVYVHKSVKGRVCQSVRSQNLLSKSIPEFMFINPLKGEYARVYVHQFFKGRVSQSVRSQIL